MMRFHLVYSRSSVREKIVLFFVFFSFLFTGCLEVEYSPVDSSAGGANGVLALLTPYLVESQSTTHTEDTPSPGTDDSAAAGTVATPTFTPVAGLYTSNQLVTITSATGGASIYYTTDGTTPGTSAGGSTSLYTGAIPVAGSGTTITIKAIATAAGSRSSSVASGTFRVIYPLVYLPIDSVNQGKDFSGNGFDFSPVGAVAYTTDRHGNANEAVNFPDDSFSYYSGPAINLGNQFTFAAWIRPRDQDDGAIIANSGSSISDGFRFFVNKWATSPPDGSIALETANGTTAEYAGAPAGTIAYDVWQHIAVTMDRANGTAEIYIDGSFLKTAVIRTDFSVTNAIRVGRLTSGHGDFNGDIDDVRIYQTLLTADEIAALAK